ncbi:MAG: hypothetical protein WC402_05730, partial [Candidatus Pacearchaeota archaeon]
KEKTTKIPVIAFPQSVPKSHKLIEVKGDYPQNFYIKLEQEINDCYNSGFLNATFFLSRKIVESFVYDILCDKFPGERNIWWNEEYNQPKSLSPLIKAMYDNRKKFEPNVTKIIEKVNDLLEEFRNFVNPVTHNLYDYLSSKDELDKFKINDIIQLLANIWRSIKPENKK